MKVSYKGLILVTTLFSFFFSCSKKEEGIEKKEEATKVVVKEVLLSDQKELLSYSGTIEADNTVSIGFIVSGRVNNVAVQEGQHVSKGQLLATIETTNYQNSLDVANATLEQAQDNFNRLDQLYGKKSLPERDYIQAKVALSQAKANRQIAIKNLQDTKLYASFSGIISQKLTEVGATVAPGVPSFTIVKTDKVYSTASITESEIGLLEVGTPVEIYIPSLNENISGKISIVNPQADNYSKTYTAKVRLENSNGKLLPGMMTNMNIITGKNIQSIAVPSTSVIRDPDNVSYVFIAKPDQTAFKKRITIGGVSGMNDVIIKEGLEKGDMLIIEGQSHIYDGSKIKF